MLQTTPQKVFWNSVQWCRLQNTNRNLCSTPKYKYILYDLPRHSFGACTYVFFLPDGKHSVPLQSLKYNQLESSAECNRWNSMWVGTKPPDQECVMIISLTSCNVVLFCCSYPHTVGTEPPHSRLQFHLHGAWCHRGVSPIQTYPLLLVTSVYIHLLLFLSNISPCWWNRQE